MHLKNLTKDDSMEKAPKPLVIQSKSVIIAESCETSEYPFNQPQTPKRPLKPVVDDLKKRNFLKL